VNMGLELEREQCVHGLFSEIKRLIKGAYRRKLALSSISPSSRAPV
jgi:hypothetical protein